uniref:ATP synthase complex subunit 8 n=1 Tax=Agrilus ornatus TaxID=2951065 RepID=A0A8X8M1B5_9COLE|nr:ATP synthase F0 subunit 8 [Agrilus ornatus]URW97758.1 ATP synthase F0 subunit 8 [Agrilus ornatus]
MPQMAPMSWLLLFAVFSITFLFFSVLNYYSSLQNPSEIQPTLFKKKNINWKW